LVVLILLVFRVPFGRAVGEVLVHGKLCRRWLATQRRPRHEIRIVRMTGAALVLLGPRQRYLVQRFRRLGQRQFLQARLVRRRQRSRRLTSGWCATDVEGKAGENYENETCGHSIIPFGELSPTEQVSPSLPVDSVPGPTTRTMPWHDWRGFGCASGVPVL